MVPTQYLQIWLVDDVIWNGALVSCYLDVILMVNVVDEQKADNKL